MIRKTLSTIILCSLALLVFSCDDGGGSPCGNCNDGIACTQDACDRDAGRCTHQPDHSICGLGFTCDLTQGCIPAAPCEVNLDCDDHNACTFDVCDPDTGCVHNPNDLACDDGNECTENDACANGVCTGSSMTCDDQNPCTDDSCLADRGCLFSPNSESCDDGNPCTIEDICTDKTCQGSVNSCDDNNSCTSDSCDPDSGCVNENNSAGCDDGDPCTEGDSCSEGICQGSQRQCHDDNPCTDDSCDSQSGCIFSDNQAACDDGNPCTENDTCSGGSCQGGNNTCACQDTSDCESEEDGDPCNGTLICDDNQCVVDQSTVVSCDSAGDTDCTKNMCDPADGQCKPTPVADTTPCDDAGPCYFNTTCSGGECVGTDVVCDDGNDCTDDSCDGQTGCQTTPNNADCDDGNDCTENDSCQNSQCQPGDPKDCSDDDPCTDDLCAAQDGSCYWENNQDPCDDGQACTNGDTCSDGTCQAGGESCCEDNLDNDSDQATDCDDPDCDTDPACTTIQVDWCRLHHPPSIAAEEGSLATVYGHLNIVGLTNLTSGVDPNPLVLGQVGWGPDGSQPSAGGWIWSQAQANAGWDDSGEVDNDEYMGELVLPPASGSPYDYAFRFSADAGQSWVYCDLASGQLGEDGSENGYQPENAGALTSSAGSHDDSNWDFETAWSAGQTPEDFLLSSAQISAQPETTLTNDGARACALNWSSSEDQSLLMGWQFTGGAVATDYTVHTWVSDQDPAGRLIPALDFAGTVDMGSPSQDQPGFVELTHTAQSASSFATLRGVLVAQDDPAYWDGDAAIVVDDVDLTVGLAFDTSDGVLDSWSATSPASPVELATTPLPLHGALNDQGQLYLSTSAAESGSTDKMVFVWVGQVDPSATVLLPWGKNGSLAKAASGSELLVLIAEEFDGYCEWRRHNGADWEVISGGCTNGSVLEGQVDLSSLLGIAASELAGELSFAAVRINTGDGGSMWSSHQTPPCVLCNNDQIDPDETLAIHRARLLVGRVQ